MFNINCFSLGCFCALIFVAFMEKLPLSFIICLFGAVANAAILWR